jgi:hypothetical protein
MSRHLRVGSRRATFTAAVLFVAAGCSGGAAVVSSPSPSAIARPVATAAPTPTPSPSPVPSRPPSPSPSPTPAPSASAIQALKIGSPYTLVDNPANTALNASFNFSMGSVVVTETISGREVRQHGKTIGLVYVLEMDGVPMSSAVFEAGARGAAANSGGKLTYGTVLGHKVAYVVTKTASFAMYLHHDAIVMVGAESLSLTKTLLTSVIKANR